MAVPVPGMEMIEVQKMSLLVDKDQYRTNPTKLFVLVLRILFCKIDRFITVHYFPHFTQMVQVSL